MFDYQISFESPWYLLLLLLLPLLWWFSIRSLALLGRIRRWLVIGLRSLVLVAIIVALAEIQMVRVSDKLTVIYLLDQSLSIPTEQRRAMIEYVEATVKKHRPDGDRVGVFVFGRDAAIEVPPFDDDVQLSTVVESALDREHTNLAGAVKLAQASFPEDAAKRIVLISDGNENLGDALEQAQGAAGSGIGIDVFPVFYEARSDVAVERLIIPSDVRQGQPFDMKVVVNNTAQPTADNSGEITGRLVVSQLTDEGPVELSEDRVTLPPGKRRFSVRQEIDRPSFYTYEARFVPDETGVDSVAQNNRATAFTHIRGKGSVLLIEDYLHKGEHTALVDTLQRQNLEVTVQPSDRLFSTLAELQQFDTVVLANVPRSTDAEVGFSDAQIETLVRNTQQMGAGLVMLGGPNSFGAGGWTGTELEKAMPVDFQIKSAKVVPQGALVMLLHACEIPEGNKIQKVIAREAIKVLGSRDYCGILHWAGRDQWMWGNGLLQVGPNRQQMMGRVDRMTPGDMPQFGPAMTMALNGFQRVPGAAVKHMIIISDGDPSKPGANLLTGFANAGITISTVSVGAHGRIETQTLGNIAQQTGGKFYAASNPNALPRIFQNEASRVARPLVHENEAGFQPQLTYPHEMLRGIEGAFPDITGFVLTTKKENPLVEVSMLSPEPAGKAPENNRTLLASWTYGLGKAVAFTSDAGAQWTTGWTAQAMYEKFFGQMIRWSMRPVNDTGTFNVATELHDGEVDVVVTALDKNDNFLNYLDINVTAIGPDLKSIPVEIKQAAPGRYVGRFPSGGAGSYFLAINPGSEHGLIRTGMNIPYSNEFRDRTTNEALLGEIADLTPKGGKKPGQLITADEKSAFPDPLLAVNTFRHNELPKATSSQDIWFFLVFVGSCTFLFDVFFRRVQVSLMWVPPLVGRLRDQLLGRDAKPRQVETMQRLRSKKAQVSTRIEQFQADARFEVPEEAATDLEDIDETPGPMPEPKSPSGVEMEPSNEESYTERLLRAKKKAWDGKEGDPPS